MVPSLLFAAALALDGGAAKEHASKLAALGPHPFGSPRGRFAAEYVAAQFRSVGLQEVRLLPVASGDARGANVVGVLRGSGQELVVLCAHHDTAQDSPGAYGSGGGVGLLIESARALARGGERPRTFVFASLDGREPLLGGRGGLGARAYVQSLGRQAQDVVGVLVVDRAGRKGLDTALETPAYADPLRPGGTVVAPEGLVRAAVLGGSVAGVPVVAGDSLWPWLQQAAVRTFRMTEAGDDRPFLEAGVPALRLSGRRFLARDPHDLGETDTAAHLDDDALGATGKALIGAASVLQNAARPVGQGDWFLAFGRVAGRAALFLAGALSLLPGLLMAWRVPRLSRGLRLVHAALFALLLYRHPVPTLFAFFLWNVLTAFGPRLLGLVLGALPVLALVGIGALAWSRGAVAGVHLAVWELVLGAFVAALALASGRRRASRAKGGKPLGGKKGLPRR